MNSVNITGRLTADPELKTTKSDTAVTGLRIAIGRPRRGGEDQGADYIDVTAFGTQAETAAQYLTKGRKVAVTGRLHHSEWDSENGRRQKLEVIAENIEFLDPKQADSQETTSVADAA
jgi:single-strand DNA-binding protein